MCGTATHFVCIWLTHTRCPHYFVTSCNLIHNFFGLQLIASQLMSTDEAWLSTWFLNNCIRKCSLLCPDSISSLFNDVSTTMKLHNAVSAVVNWRLSTELEDTWNTLQRAEWLIQRRLLTFSLTVQSCVHRMTELAKTDIHLAAYFTTCCPQNTKDWFC